MSSEHCAWDASLANDLDRLRIDYSAKTDLAIEEIIRSIRLYGFAIVSGLGSGTNKEDVEAELKALASRAGDVVQQSPRGERVESIRDFSDVDERDERGYRSRGPLAVHSDPPTLILLHCLRPAKSGGENYLVNVRAIHDRIKERSPELCAVLYRDFPWWRVDGESGIAGQGPDAQGRPVFAELNGVVSCVYYRPHIDLFCQETGTKLTAEQNAALDLFDEYSRSPDLAMRFLLQRGDTLILHNRAVLHARTDYEDFDDPSLRRHLLRVWIDSPLLFPAAPDHELGDLFASSKST